MHAFNLNEITGDYDINYPVTGNDIVAMADELLVERLARLSAECFQNLSDVKTFLKLRLAHYKSEVFAVLFVNNRHHMLAFDEMFHGTIDGASVHRREVVRRTLEHNAAAVILATIIRREWQIPAARISRSHDACQTPWYWSMCG